MNFEKGKNFRKLTTFKTGGKIRYLFQIKNVMDILGAVRFAKEKKLPIFILGGGSDILVSDKKFNGVVIKYTSHEIKYERRGKSILARVNSGMKWDNLVREVVRRNLKGIECLSGIPGTVGAAPVQNIGAYGQELKDVFNELTAFDMTKEKFVTFKNKDCKFGYRESVFKKKKYWQRYLITEVCILLKKSKRPTIKYDSLKSYLSEKKVFNPTLEDVRNAVLRIRSGKFENPSRVGNAGSFFKNPVIRKKVLESIKRKYPDVKYFEQNDGHYKVFAGWLIERAGWKGRRYKTAAVSPRHALVLINPEGKSRARDILTLSKKIIDDVFKKFGIKMEREVQLVNF